MIKKIAFTLFLLLTISACSDDKIEKNNASNTSTLESTSSNKNTSESPQVSTTTPDNGNGEEVELTEQDMLAMDLINDEIFFDECNAYAQEDSIDKSDLDSYLNDCVEQLKLQASVIIDTPDEEKQTETTPPTTSEVLDTPK